MRAFAVALLIAASVGPRGFAAIARGTDQPQARRQLYVALPVSDADPDRAVRVLVFDAANAHRFVRRITLWPPSRGGDAETVRAASVHAGTGRLYLSTTTRLAAVDLKTGR